MTQEQNAGERKAGHAMTLHNAWFRHATTDAVIVLIYFAEPIVDTRTFGDRPIAQAEQIALDAEVRLNASLCSIIELGAL